MLDEFPHFVVQLPGNLDTARPVIGIGDGGIPAFGQPGGLGIENQVHGVLGVLRSSIKTDFSNDGLFLRGSKQGLSFSFQLKKEALKVVNNINMRKLKCKLLSTI